MHKCAMASQLPYTEMSFYVFGGYRPMLARPWTSDWIFFLFHFAPLFQPWCLLRGHASEEFSVYKLCGWVEFVWGSKNGV